MKRKMKMFFSMLVIFTLIVSMAGCVTKNNDTSKTIDTTGQVVEKTEKYEISWLNFGAQHIVDGNPIEKIIEEKFNVDIKVVKADVQDTEKINLMLASGEMPDVMMPYGNPKEYWDQGLIRSIPFDMVRKYIPGFAKVYDKHPIAWLTSLVPEKDNEFLGLPAISEGISGPSFVDMWRLDWLENIGVKPHGTLEPIIEGKMWWTTEPFTFDEMEQIFKAFVNNDPNKNGQKDTYATVGYKDSLLWNYINLAQSFGLVWSRNLMEDGELKMYYTANAYKEFLKWMSKMYKDGMVDKEITILDFTKMWEKIATGNVGYWIVPYSYVGAMPETAPTSPPYSVLVNYPESKVLVTPPVKGKSGKSIGYQYLELETLASYWTFISSKVSDDKLIKILQILEYTTFNSEMRNKVVFGEEGIHWEWSGKPYASSINRLVALGPEQAGELGVGGTYGAINSSYTKEWLTYVETPELNVVASWIRDPKKGGLISGRSYRYDVFGETNLGEINKQYGSEINTQVQEFSYKCITGQIDVESSWNSYIDKLMRSGLNEMLEEIKKAPLTDELHKGTVKY